MDKPMNLVGRLLGCPAIVAAVTISIAASRSDAAVVINAVQSAGSVEIAVTGGFDMTGYGPPQRTGVTTSGASIHPALPNFQLGAGAVTPFDEYNGIVTVPLPIYGSGELHAASAQSGVLFAVLANGNVLLPSGYASNDPLNSSTTFAGDDFASLGITPGTYTYPLTNGETITLNAIVPEPTVLPMLLGALGLLAVRRRRGNA